MTCEDGEYVSTLLKKCNNGMNATRAIMQLKALEEATLFYHSFFSIVIWAVLLHYAVLFYIGFY